MTPSNHIVFDVIGTLVSYCRIHEAIDRRIGDRLCAAGVRVPTFGFMWIEVAGKSEANVAALRPF